MRKTSLISLIILIVGLAGLTLMPARAQDGDTEPSPTPYPTPYTGVTVTTQDFASLRVGPGTSFDRMTVVDPGLTLPAIGRSADGDWVQVYHDGQTGWIAAWLLVWYGDLVSLPVDGVNPAPFVRRMVAEGITTRETPIYIRQISAEDQVGVLPPGTHVELTGRLGSKGMYLLQIRYEGQLYWVGAWNIRITGGYELNLFDTSYLYAFGRLVNQLGKDVTSISSTMREIEGLWLRLRNGESVSCAYIPDYASRRTSDSDVGQEPRFGPLVSALDAGINATNTAISTFADACGREDGNFYLTEQDVRAALEQIDTARRNLNVAASLLASLRHRDPLLGDKE